MPLRSIPTLFALLLGLAALGFVACDADGDDDDAADEDDDIRADDDSGDDDTGPAACGTEPLAAIDCPVRCAGVGETLAFSAERSTDPAGRPLTYVFDFGDGATAQGSMAAQHAYDAPGAYRVTVTATAGDGCADVSACLVSVGDFPTGGGILDEIAFQPSHFNPEIREPIDPPEHGGLITGYFVAGADAVPDTVLVNGQPGDPRAGNVEWCEVVQPELRAGEIGILRCHTLAPAFDAGNQVSLSVREGDRVIWDFAGTIPAPTLSPSYITTTKAGDEILVHVRNDADGPITVTGLKVDGVDVSRFAVIDNPALDPGEIAVVRVPRCDGSPYGAWTVFTVLGTTGKAEVSSSRALRLFPPVFPIGNWNGGDIFTDPEELQRELGLGLNLFIYSPDGTPPATVFDLAEAHDFYVFTHKGGGIGQDFVDFVGEWGGNPRLLMNAVSGEGDLGGEAADALADVRMHRALWGSGKPLWVYNACASHFPSWGPLADYGGMDHYCVWAPKCNNNRPPFYWDHILFSGLYTEEIKRASEPTPVVNWTQAISNVSEFEIGGESLYVRCTSADEIRAQWYMLLGRGTKGMLWFLFRENWYARCPGAPTEQMGIVARELRGVEDIVLAGETATPGAVAEDDIELVDMATLISPYGALIVLSNLDYDLNLIGPWEWHPQPAVTVDFYPPEDFEPGAFLLLENDARIPLAAEKVSANHYRVVVTDLKVAAAVAVLPEP
jgi:hypothetical protein